MNPEDEKAQRDKSSSVVAYIIVFTLIFVIAVAVVVGSQKAMEEKHEDHPFRSAVPEPLDAADFQLTDHDGKPFQLESLKSKVVLLTFGFTHCASICPNILGNLASVYRQLPPEVQKRVAVLFITIDPDRDTAAILKDYVPFFNPAFVGLTGTNEEIKKIAKDYGAFYERSPQGRQDEKDYSMDHSTYTYLIDPQGKIVMLYRMEQVVKTQQVVKDVEKVLSKK